MTVDSEAIFAIAEGVEAAAVGARRALRLDGVRLDRRARPRHPFPRPRHRPPPLDRRGQAGALLRFDAARRSSSSSATRACGCASASSARARSLRSSTAPSRREALPARPTFQGIAAPAVRAPEERRFCLARLAAIAPPRRDASPSARPRAFSTSGFARGTGTSSRRPCRPAKAGRPATPESGGSLPPCGRPVCEPRQAPEPACEAASPCTSARSQRSSRRGTSKPASRRAFENEPKVCQ